MGVNGCVVPDSPSGIANTYRLYEVIGEPERISLSKLALEHLERTGRPFRLAVDFSIWHFQLQSGQGGANPALRTFYYRLLRLLSLCIQPLFVFDGPERPAFKRDKHINRHFSSQDHRQVKRLLTCLGFSYHQAPGEAEAECAALQKEGLVDAVLSEDVDVFLFGCSRSVRNWSPQQATAKVSTHIDLYSTEKILQERKLDPRGMILIALMSGGDYDTAGITRCGYKTAYEAAKAGFGRDLMAAAGNSEALKAWRIRLQHELRTNESRFFRSKHKAIVIPDNFPDPAILVYYRHPVVSSKASLKELKTTLDKAPTVDVDSLKKFVSANFHWHDPAEHFVGNLAGPLLVQQIFSRRKDLEALEKDGIASCSSPESELIVDIVGRREHWETDGKPELRIVYDPSKVVGLPTLDTDEKSRIWISEQIVRLGCPDAVTRWERKAAAVKPAQKKKPARKPDPQTGAMEKYLRLTRPIADLGIVRPAIDARVRKPVITEPEPTKPLAANRVTQPFADFKVSKPVTEIEAKGKKKQVVVIDLTD